MSKPLEPRYSGPTSKDFWDRINAIRPNFGNALYQLGCALQDLEGRALTALQDAEREHQAKRKRV